MFYWLPESNSPYNRIRLWIAEEAGVSSVVSSRSSHFRGSRGEIVETSELIALRQRKANFEKRYQQKRGGGELDKVESAFWG